MKNKWRSLFWISLVVLIISNLFWFYQTIDSAVGRSYLEVSCNEYEKDMLLYKKIVESKKNKLELLQFLKKNNIDVVGFQKGEGYIISFNSFSVEYDEKGNKINEQTR